MTVPSRQRREIQTGASAPATIVIAGGGPTGMALALALHQAGRAVVVHEARERAALASDARILALSHGTRQVLERLSAWPTEATPIASVHVSHRHGLGRTLIRAEELDAPALGYVVPARMLIVALNAALARAGIQYFDYSPVTAAHAVAGGERVELFGAGERPLGAAALLVWAEGVVHDEGARTRDYAQHAVLCTVATETPHDGRAWERFTDDGPLALLPLGRDYAVILTVAAADLARVMALDDDGFRAELQRRFGARHRFGALTPRRAYPLGLRWREQVAGARQVWLGNAAQTLHPVAGQGFNLALRDAWELAETLANEDDPGATAPLARYAERRDPDRRGTILFTDFLIDTFASDVAPLRHVRSAGLLALDLFPPLRRFVAKRLMYGARGGL